MMYSAGMVQSASSSKQPIALRALPRDQRVARERDGAVEERRDRLGERERNDVGPRLGPGAGLQLRVLCDAAHVPELPYERRRGGSDVPVGKSSSAPEGGSNSVRTACGRRSSPSRPSGNPRAAPAKSRRSINRCAATHPSKGASWTRRIE